MNKAIVFSRVRTVVLLLVVAVVVVSSVSFWRAAPAQAASPKYNYQKMCGEKYKYKGSKTFKNGIILVYTRQKGQKTDWCAFTKRTGDAYGSAGLTGVYLVVNWKKGAAASDSAGNIKYFAGPARVYNRAKMASVLGEVAYGGDYRSAAINDLKN